MFRFLCFFWLFMGAGTSAMGRQSPILLMIGLVLSVLSVGGILGIRLASLLMLAFWGIALLATVGLTFAGNGTIIGNFFLCLLYAFFGLVSLAGYEPIEETSVPEASLPSADYVIVPLEPPLLVL
jgi:hypothetical protein